MQSRHRSCEFNDQLPTNSKVGREKIDIAGVSFNDNLLVLQNPKNAKAERWRSAYKDESQLPQFQRYDSRS